VRAGRIEVKLTEGMEPASIDSCLIWQSLLAWQATSPSFCPAKKSWCTPEQSVDSSESSDAGNNRWPMTPGLASGDSTLVNRMILITGSTWAQRKIFLPKMQRAVVVQAFLSKRAARSHIARHL